MRILYVTAVKPTLPNGIARFESKLSAYVEAGSKVGVVCGVEPGDAPEPIDGVEFFPLEALACECKVVVTEVPGMRLWIEQNVPGASVFYVEPPRMQGLDEPLKCDLADFEQRLSDAIKEAVLAPLRPVDVSRLSWGKRIGCIVEECFALLDKES